MPDSPYLSDDTLAYYAENAQAYASRTLGVDMSSLRKRLTQHLRPGASILDAGCGSGRDSAAFLNIFAAHSPSWAGPSRSDA